MLEALVTLLMITGLFLAAAGLVEGSRWLRHRVQARRAQMHEDDWGAEGWSVHRW